MISKIDWLSFTVKMDHGVYVDSTWASEFLMSILRKAFPRDIEAALFDQPYALAHGRAPYNVCLRREDQFVSLYAGGGQAHILVEISGGGCEALQRQSALLPLLALVEPLLTRLDVAVDLPVETSPHSFVGAGYSARIKSKSHMISETGETCYIGSRDSERYCRVYRYAAPHPRSAWLRVEYVNKHELARSVAKLIRDVGLVEVVARLGNTFEWQHPAWQPDKATEAAISGWTPERRHGATVRWLLTSVFPAMAKLVKDGTIEDLSGFLEQHLYTLLND